MTDKVVTFPIVPRRSHLTAALNNAEPAPPISANMTEYERKRNAYIAEARMRNAMSTSTFEAMTELGYAWTIDELVRLVALVRQAQETAAGTGGEAPAGCDSPPDGAGDTSDA